MTRGGKRDGAGRPTRSDKEGKQPKVVLSCRVEAETLAFLDSEKQRTDRSIGELTDLAVFLLQKHPEESFPSVEA
ncbi:hypothetical protein [Vampirovibrio sp.]|uniref:hypothetical protein n=1 Tax=Vampirovibrio sp. TaxID=2717857 RepID=UPI00359423A1